MGINGFEGVGLEWLLSQWESSYLRFLEKGKILKGEREKPIYWCMLFELTLFFLS